MKTKTRFSIFTLFWLLAFSAFSASAEEVKENFKNLTVNANLVMAEGKTLADDVVLLTHGTTTHNGRETYRSIQKLLAEQGISSLAPNLSLNVNDRHGEVNCALPQTHKHEDALEEMGFWLDWLKAKGATSVTLMGHSRGGNQTAWFSVERDEPVIKKVILIAPQTWSKEAEHKDYAKKYDLPLQPILNSAEKLVKEGKGDTMLKGINFIYCKDTSATAEAFVSYYKDEPRMDTPTLLKKALKPTLVIMGSADKVVADLPKKMENVDNDLVQTYSIEDSDHFFLDLFSEELVETAVEFIQE
ncbi:alpha/beta hydrolase [Thiomicrorhabdus chilensis]|uniref:alpha/beta hydrolase n=1 Tax=Thiomicrorhabdus chilensis TaxID=63656 RepID=UPI00040BC3E6|nr:alpha/beta hydrolase [Thiomicrorhabdus chilensis]